MGSLFEESAIKKIISYIEEPILLYVLIQEEYHDNGTIIGLFRSREEALEGFRDFRYDVDNKKIDGYYHIAENIEDSQKCLEGLKTNDSYALNGQNSDTWYMIRMFKVGEIDPKRC